MKKDFKLEDIPRRTLYQVPEDYFDKLPGMIMARVTSSKTTAEAGWFTSLFYQYRAALAGMLLLTCFTGTFLFSLQQPFPIFTSDIANIPDILHQDVIEYVSNQVEIDSRDLAELTITNNDISHEFINATTDDILQSVDEQQLEEVYFN